MPLIVTVRVVVTWTMENMKHGTSFAITRLQIAKNTMPILKLKSQHTHSLAIHIKADSSEHRLSMIRVTQPANLCCSMGIETLTRVNFQSDERLRLMSMKGNLAL